MQSGGDAAGGGRKPGAPPPPSSAPLPASGLAHLGPIQQQQQQLAYRQLLQQSQQLRKAEVKDNLFAYQSGGVHGATGGSNFPSSSNAPTLPQPAHEHGAPQLHQENQNKAQVVGQHMQNLTHQAYLQYAFQAAQQKTHGNMAAPQQGNVGTVGPSWRGQDMLVNNLRMQELMSLQAANQRQLSISNKTTQSLAHNEKHMEILSPSSDDLTPQVARGHISSANMIRSSQQPQSAGGLQSTASNQMAMAQLQAMQTRAQEPNIDSSRPADVNLIAQVLPLWQSARMASMVNLNETNIVSHQSYMSPSKQQIMSSPASSENSAHMNSLSNLSTQAGPVESRQTIPSGSVSSGGANTAANSNSVQIQQHQLTAHSRENQNDKVGRTNTMGNGTPMLPLPQSSGGICQNEEHSDAKNALSDTETQQMQQVKTVQQLTRSHPKPAIPSSNCMVTGNQTSSHGGLAKIPQQRVGFTKQQLHVLKAQILAFRRLKRGERILPHEVLEGITPPPLDSQLQEAAVPPVAVNRGSSVRNNAEEHVGHAGVNGKAPALAVSNRSHEVPKDELSIGEEKGIIIDQTQRTLGSSKESADIESTGNVHQNSSDSLKPELKAESGSQQVLTKSDSNGDQVKPTSAQNTIVDAGEMKKPAPASNTIVSKDVTARKYHGPLFDFPSFTRKHDSVGLTNANCSSNLTLAYDVNDLLFEEGMDVFNKKRTENLKKISGLLAVNLERKRIRPDLVLRMQIEEKKLRLFDLQARLRDEVDQEQQEIMAMSDRPYRKFVKQCERQRVELLRQVQQFQKLVREKQLKSIFLWRKKVLDVHWGIRDARITRNRGVAKYHEKMLREFSKRKDEDRNKRMEALKNNDVDRYREILLEQQTNVPGDAAQRYTVLSSFLSQTEEYLHKLGGKITAVKNHQEVEEAANAAVVAARSQGLSEEEVKTAAVCARDEVMIRSRFSEMNAPQDNSSVNKYYNLAHAVNERVLRQPSMLRAGTLRDYQLVGLQWMLSLYNNKLNGILADEMGLGKTVQVIALIAYLMEFKGNYGPHLIIVPNAVLVNWKSELLNWLPSVSCVFYAGVKDQRAKLFAQVRAVKFNILVTTYEFIMYDRSKLSKIEWKYIIIDEAQRMKDRESVLARNLDRYRCHRRLLLTGTPLQNDLRELWSLLNLLLPEVFDNSRAFHDWFSKPFQKDAPSHNPEEDDWLETEKKVIIIHRLHQILEPFMLRRRVEDVEGSLPPKVPVVLRCRMSSMQSAIYDWIKSTGTIRVDPEEELRRIEKNPKYQAKMYRNLNNKCMELRKVCNHPLLNYPYFNDLSKEFIVRSCGKLWILDRILMKLQCSGHRVLLFSTMTKLLDILEEYLQWRRLVYRRIDGTTSLEDRESAIVDFNGPDSDCFIFLLSIRAAGRGLNLQTADTVVIYDPDPNPQNEEQAVARAHRIGQKREVKVIYLEAVADKISSYQKEEIRAGGTGDSEDDLAGKDRYVGSIESLIRNNIQQYKIDMADEVINAGRFDQRTTHEERRMTLETLLHDDERSQESVHDVPSLREVNRLIARSEEERELFDQMDEDFDWTREMLKYNEVPKWLRAGSREVNAVSAKNSKKPLKNILAGNIGLDSVEQGPSLSPSKNEKRRGRPKGLSNGQSYPIYKELDDEDEDSDASSERDTSPFHEEEGEIEDLEDEECNGDFDLMPNIKEQLEERIVSDCRVGEFAGGIEGNRSFHLSGEAVSTVSSAGSRKVMQLATPSMSLQKFGSLSALDARPGPTSKMMTDELEEGEIAVSSDSQMDLQPSGDILHDRDGGEDEQALQPKLKRKRSIRVRSRCTVERVEEKSSSERIFSQSGLQQQFHGGHDYDMQSRTDSELEVFSEPVSGRRDAITSSNQRRNFHLRNVSPALQNSGKLSYLSESAEEAPEHSRGTRNGRTLIIGTPSSIDTKMSDSTQRKCKNVISKLQRRMEKDGHQLIPILYDLWKRNMKSTFATPVSLTRKFLDLQSIEQSVDRLEYTNVSDFIGDVQLMLRNVVQQCDYSYEVRYEAGKLQDLFFDIMKIAFPDTDFQEARNATTFSVPGGAATARSPRQPAASQSKRHARYNEVEPDSGPIKTVPHGASPINGEGRTRGNASKVQKETMPSGSISRDQAHPACSPHPGELVICKKKRKDRDKYAVKQRTGPLSPSNPGLLGSPSPSLLGRAPPASPLGTNRSARVQFQKDVHSSQPTGREPLLTPQPGNEAGSSFNIGELRWAKPVKRMRTDTGKRRPSHL